MCFVVLGRVSSASIISIIAHTAHFPHGGILLTFGADCGSQCQDEARYLRHWPTTPCDDTTLYQGHGEVHMSTFLWTNDNMYLERSEVVGWRLRWAHNGVHVFTIDLQRPGNTDKPRGHRGSQSGLKDMSNEGPLQTIYLNNALRICHVHFRLCTEMHS